MHKRYTPMDLHYCPTEEDEGKKLVYGCAKGEKCQPLS